jgi:hypothetical protein
VDILWAVTDDRDLSGVVAHGLLNTIAVISGSAHTLLQLGDRIPDGDREILVGTLAQSAELFGDGMQVLLRHCSDPFGDAATAITLLGRAIHSVPADELPQLLDGIVVRARTVRVGLEALVRGLPAEVLDLLDSLQR